MKKPLNLRIVALVAAITLLCGSFLLAQDAATLVSDKDDYAPGEVATLTGAGFWPNEGIDLSIAIDDPETGTYIGDWDWTDGYADANGGFVVGYTVPDEAAGMRLTASALGLESALVATAGFTDNVITVILELPQGFAVSPLGDKVCTSVTVTTVGGTVSEVSATIGSVSGPGAGINCDLEESETSSNLWTMCCGAYCGTTYKLNNVQVRTSGGSAPRNYTETYGQNAPQATTPNCPPEPTCPEQSPPTISASDLDKGQIVGCLEDGSFETTVTFGPGDFEPVTSDPNDDPVTVTADKFSCTLVGPGNAECTVVLTATDDPSGRDVSSEVDCDPLEPLSASTTVKVKAQIIYAGSSNGTGSPFFTSPFQTSKALQVKRGSGFPVKFRLYDCGGTEICTNLGFGDPQIDVVYGQSNTSIQDPTVTDSGAANDDGDLFRYGGTCGVDGNWIFNLKTNTTYVLGASYKVRAYLNDGTMIEGTMGIKP